MFSAVCVCGSVALLFPGLSCSGSKPAREEMKPFVVQFQTGNEYQSLFGGPPKTIGFRSGRVVLRPGESVGQHSTERYEEAVIVLEGQGEAFGETFPALSIKERTVLYVPPHTIHNVRNTGQGVLKYIYLVAPVEGK
jgi:mannose-6-phosphate isomerase-like protein (cupin superfamily)